MIKFFWKIGPKALTYYDDIFEVTSYFFVFQIISDTAKRKSIAENCGQLGLLENISNLSYCHFVEDDCCDAKVHAGKLNFCQFWRICFFVKPDSNEAPIFALTFNVRSHFMSIQAVCQIFDFFVCRFVGLPHVFGHHFHAIISFNGTIPVRYQMSFTEKRLIRACFHMKIKASFQSFLPLVLRFIKPGLACQIVIIFRLDQGREKLARIARLGLFVFSPLSVSYIADLALRHCFNHS